MKQNILNSHVLIIKILFFSVLSASIYLTGCQSEDAADVNQNRIYVDYNFTYDASQDVTRAVATFSFGSSTGTRLTLSGNSSITFNNKELQLEDIFVSYETQISGFQPSGTFIYTDLDGNTFTNTAQMRRADLPTNQQLTIDKSGSYEVSWEGSALSTSETIIAKIDPDDNTGSILASTDNTGATSVIFGADQFEEILPGNAALDLERSHSIQNIEGTEAGGRFDVTYTSDDLNVTIQ